MCFCTPTKRMPFCPNCTRAMFLRIDELRDQLKDAKEYHEAYREEMLQGLEELEGVIKAKDQRITELEKEVDELTQYGREMANGMHRRIRAALGGTGR